MNFLTFPLFHFSCVNLITVFTTQIYPRNIILDMLISYKFPPTKYQSTSQITKTESKINLFCGCLRRRECFTHLFHNFMSSFVTNNFNAEISWFRCAYLGFIYHSTITIYYCLILLRFLCHLLELKPSSWLHDKRHKFFAKMLARIDYNTGKK